MTGRISGRILQRSKEMVTKLITHPLSLITHPLSLITCLIFCSCSNFETSGNGDFDGYWQLESMDTLATGGTTDMHDSLVFWAVQHKLIELCSRQVEPKTFSYKYFSVFYHFERSDNTLRFIADSLSQPKDMPVIDLRSSYDPYATFEQVKVYGFSRFDETFRILQLDGDNMTLESPLFRMRFRKY